MATIKNQLSQIKRFLFLAFFIITVFQVILCLILIFDAEWLMLLPNSGIHTLIVAALLFNALTAYLILFISLPKIKNVFGQFTELNTIVSKSPIGILVVNAKGKIESLNPKMAELFGLQNQNEIIGKNALELEINKISGIDYLVRKGLAGIPFEQDIIFTRGSDKTTLALYFRGTPIFGENRELERLLLMVSDISKQKELEAKIQNYSKELEKEITARTAEMQKNIAELKTTETAMLNILEDVRRLEISLRQERDRANAVISSMGEGLILADRNLKIVLVNQSGGSLLRRAPETLFGANLAEIFKIYRGKKKEHFKLAPALKDVLEKEDILRLGLEADLYCEVEDGKSFPVGLLATPFIGEDMNGLVLIFHDVTREKELDQAKSDFISLASHQLKAPLTSVRWYIEMLESGDAGPLKPKQKNFVDKIYAGSLHLNETINLLLSLARLESGKIVGKIEKIDLKQFVNDLVNELKPLAFNKKIKFSVLLPKTPTEVTCSANELRQVLSNLVSNAIRYTKDTGKIEVNVTSNGELLTFTVKDDGIGIPGPEQEKIFQKFFRATNASEKIAEGSGLGLALAKSLIERWGGKIWFESKEGHGTEFSFTVPIKK